jgi:hypothetical protein
VPSDLSSIRVKGKKWDGTEAVPPKARTPFSAGSSEICPYRASNGKDKPPFSTKTKSSSRPWRYRDSILPRISKPATSCSFVGREQLRRIALILVSGAV